MDCAVLCSESVLGTPEFGLTSLCKSGLQHRGEDFVRNVKQRNWAIIGCVGVDSFAFKYAHYPSLFPIVWCGPGL